MKGRILTVKMLNDFKKYLASQEKSKATTEKYLRDARNFANFAGNGKITKEIVIACKEHLKENYAVRSVNSMLASINSLFVFLGWFDLKIKALKVQQQVFCSEEKELTKAEYARLCKPIFLSISITENYPVQVRSI